MQLRKRFTAAQQKRIETERKRHEEAVARAKEEGRPFNPLDEAPTQGPETNDPVEKEIRKIWYGSNENS